MRHLASWLAGLLLCLCAAMAAAAPGAVASGLVPIPPLTARVTDLTGTLDAGQKSALESRLGVFEVSKGAQVVVLILPTTQPESIEQFAIRLLETWKIGRQGIDDGAILIIAKDDRRLRIEVGYGLEGVLNDATAKRIIDETITPRFKAGDLPGGVSAGIDAILKVVAGEPLPPPPAAKRPAAQGGGQFEESLWVGILFVIAIVGNVLRHLLGNFLGAAVAGTISGGIGWLIFGSVGGVVIGALAGILLALFGLELLLSSGGGFGGSGGRGGGGFSGGGGAGGGGGASGRW